MLDILSQRKEMYLDFYQSLTDSYMSYKANTIDDQLDSSLKIIESDRERIGNQIMLENQRHRQLEQLDKKEAKARENAEN